jgi:dienelactone hydrolase
MQEFTVPQGQITTSQVMLTPKRRRRFLSTTTLMVMGCLLFFSIGLGLGKWMAEGDLAQRIQQLDVKGTTQEKTYPLLKYSFSELAKRGGVPSQIVLDRVLFDSPEFTSYVFFYTSEDRKISGQLNVPKGNATELRPVVVMLRGYVSAEDYTIGKGTSPSAASLARAGYITFAPDFLGFGESDPPPTEVLAERFVKPLNVLDLIATIESLDQKNLTFENKTVAKVDAKRLGLWGHSNGGQIALSILEITERPIPTALLAPVSKFFPYSVLYFTDTAEDKGKGLRAVIAKFEADYNIEQFSIGNNVEHINAKIQLHQGSEDAEVPQKWSDEFYSYFVGKGKKDNIEYFVYQGADHLLVPATDTVKARVVDFFDREVKTAKLEPTVTPTDVPVEEPLIDQDASPAVSSTPLPVTSVVPIATPSSTP